MIKMLSVFFLLFGAFGSVVLFLKESDGRSRTRVMKWLAYAGLCSLLSAITIGLVAVIF